MHDENDEVKPCDACDDEDGGSAIPCGICGAECRECDSCGESRYVANDGEPSMFTCSACRRAGLTIKSVVPCRAEPAQRRDVDDEHQFDPFTPDADDDLDMGGES